MQKKKKKKKPDWTTQETRLAKGCLIREHHATLLENNELFIAEAFSILRV